MGNAVRARNGAVEWLAIAVALAGAEPEVLAGVGEEGMVGWIGDDDVQIQFGIMSWAQRRFAEATSDAGSDGAAVESLATAVNELVYDASQAPSLALGAAMALYSYFWYQGGAAAAGEGRGGAGACALNVQTVGEAAVQFHRSIVHRGCHMPDLELEEFWRRGCHVRWRHLLMVSAELGRYLAVEARDVAGAARALREASSLWLQARSLPFFARYSAEGRPAVKPHDTSFNEDFLPHVVLGPIWPTHLVPLASFLEEHAAVFLAELESILEANEFSSLHLSNRDAASSHQEFGPRVDDWETVYLLRAGRWSESSCSAAPRSCELLRSRPELRVEAAADAPYLENAGAGFLRLRPGGRLKPHFGSAPRLAAHLGLVVPQAGDIGLSVGGQSVRWSAGKAIVFDDTYVHSAWNDGLEPRYVLNVWFRHPCDLMTEGAVQFRRDGVAASLPAHCSKRLR